MIGPKLAKFKKKAIKKKVPLKKSNGLPNRFKTEKQLAVGCYVL